MASSRESSMRLVTKADACRELKVSLSTLDRWIAAGRVQISKEPLGRRHRVFVIMDEVAEDDGMVNPSNTLGRRESKLGGPPTDDGALAVAQEQIRGLERLVDVLKEQLEIERDRHTRILGDLKDGRPAVPGTERGSVWWQFWKHRS